MIDMFHLLFRVFSGTTKLCGVMRSIYSDTNMQFYCFLFLSALSLAIFIGHVGPVSLSDSNVFLIVVKRVWQNLMRIAGGPCGMPIGFILAL